MNVSGIIGFARGTFMETLEYWKFRFVVNSRRIGDELNVNKIVRTVGRKFSELFNDRPCFTVYRNGVAKYEIDWITRNTLTRRSRFVTFSHLPRLFAWQPRCSQRSSFVIADMHSCAYGYGQQSHSSINATQFLCFILARAHYVLVLLNVDRSEPFVRFIVPSCIRNCTV